MVIFQDETGELGFDKGSSKFYVVTILVTDTPKRLRNIIRKFNGKLIRAGWPRNCEVKATRLFNAPRDASIPDTFKYKNNPNPLLFKVLRNIVDAVSYVDSIAVMKSTVYPHLRTLPFGILHNYYAAQILIPNILKYPEVDLFVDKRSKERHSMRHFDGYIEGKVYESVFESQQRVKLAIYPVESHLDYGISAVDYVSWAIFRRFEVGDNRFFYLVKDKIQSIKTFYF